MRTTRDDTFPAPTRRPRAHGPLEGGVLLLATDGSAGANAAARIGSALVAERDMQPHVVRAYDVAQAPLPGPLAGMLAAADALLGPAAHEEEERLVRATIGDVLGHEVRWPVRIRPGTAAGVIAREAEALGASLVVLGIRRHNRVDRLTRDETTLNVMRTADCPVLGVAADTRTLPRKAVVGLDFGPTSFAAARVALELLAPGGELVLAYVEGHEDEPDAAPEISGEGAGATDVSEAFDRTTTDLAPPAGVTVTRVCLGRRDAPSIADGLLALAAERRTDLIAIGSHRYDWVDRAFRGSVSTGLARDGRHTLLVVPPVAPPPTPRMPA